MDRATSTDHQDDGVWTEAFEQLHAAVLAGAPAEEIQRLEAAELAEAATRTTEVQPAGPVVGVGCQAGAEQEEASR